MSPLVSTSIFLMAGMGMWLAVRFSLPLNEWTRRGTWIGICVLAVVPVFVGLAETPSYLQMLVPLLCGIGGAELLYGRVEKWKQAKEAERQEEKRRRKKRRREGVKEE